MRKLILIFTILNFTFGTAQAGLFSKSPPKPTPHRLDSEVTRLNEKAKDSVEANQRAKAYYDKFSLKNNIKGMSSASGALKDMHGETAGIHRELAKTHKKIHDDHRIAGNQKEAEAALKKVQEHDQRAADEEAKSKSYGGKEALHDSQLKH